MKQKKCVEKDFEMCKIGDDKWRICEQDFDNNSWYITDGYIVYWHELVQ